MGLPLPAELIGLTFNHLDAASLSSCMKVCKLFDTIILRSTHLVYKVDLFASCMEDNEHSSIDTLSRLKLLREYNCVWHDMSWPSSGTIPMRDGICWEFSGGVLAHSTSQNELFLVQLPCKLKGIQERKWSIPFKFEIRDIAFDNSQDLLVLLELVGTPPNMSCKIHLRNLSGEHHPLTNLVQIVHAVPNLREDFTFLIQICGNRVAVLFYDPFDASSFCFWDWRTGYLEVDIHVSGLHSFAFMTGDLTLVAILRSNTEPSLQVLNVGAFIGPIRSLSDMPHTCELLIPKLLSEAGYILIRSEPTPIWKPPTGVPFYSSRKDFLFVISITMCTLKDGTPNTPLLFVPLSTVLAQVERSHNTPRHRVPWDAWGPSGTRLVFQRPSVEFETWVCYNYGMKFIQGLPTGKKKGRVAKVYDFNPEWYAAGKDVEMSSDSAGGSNSLTVSWKPLAKQSRPSDRSQSFDSKIVTSLPGRVAEVSLAHSDDGRGWDTVMIGEDHILMVQSGSMYGYMAM